MPVTSSVRSIAGAFRSPAISRWLRIIGPAWIVMLADVDAPSVITAGQGGTSSGYALLLPIFALVPILFLVQEMTARLALATGKGHAELIRSRYGPRWAAVSVGGMAVINFVAYVSEFAVIALGAAILGVPAPVAIVGALVLHAGAVLTGGYSVFERGAVLLSLALFSFVVLAIVGHPNLGHLFADLNPLPSDVPHDYFALVVAVVGASIMPWMLFYQQSASVDKKLTREDLKGSRIETLLGAFASQALMAAIVIAAAAAMESAPALSSATVTQLPEGLARLASFLRRLLRRGHPCGSGGPGFRRPRPVMHRGDGLQRDRSRAAAGVHRSTHRRPRIARRSGQLPAPQRAAVGPDRSRAGLGLIRHGAVPHLAQLGRRTA
jgi:Mn2+/Fe2+ NRAMP family transporter